MPEQLLNGREVAEILHVSRSFAYLLMRSGKLPTVRLGKSVRVHPRDLDKYLYHLRRPELNQESESCARMSGLPPYPQ